MSTETVKEGMELQKSKAPLAIREVGMTAAAAETQAMVQARFVMALQNKRNLWQVEQDLLKECSRPSFALEEEEGKGNGALYRRPVGSKEIDGRWVQQFVEGLGIRFAEVAIRCMKNIMQDSFVIQDTDTERVLHVFVLDLESNTSYGKTITISKTVERRKLKEGQIPIKEWTNSQGKRVYTVYATEGELVTKEGAELSKTLRTLALRLIPGDFQDSCIAKIKDIRMNKVTEDPDAALKKVVNGMLKQNVSATMLEEFLEHPIDQITPAEIVNLQSLYRTLADGEVTWAEVMADAAEYRLAKKKEPAESDKGVAAMKEKIAQEQQQQTAVQEPTQTSQDNVQAPIDVCSGCGNTAGPMTNINGNMLCENCKPKPTPPPPAVTEQPATATAPTQTQTQAAPPWQRPVVPTQPPVETKPVNTAPPAATDGPKPWEKPKAAPTAPAQESKPTPVQSEPVAPLNLASEDVPAKGRIKPVTNPIKFVILPEFVDRASPEDAWTQEQFDRACRAISKIPGADPSNIPGSLASTVKQAVGIDVEEINKETMEALIGILEHFNDKAGRKAWAQPLGLWAGE